VSLELADLDPCTRRFMLAELEADIAAGTLYQSPQLSETGLGRYSRLLRDAIMTGTDESFAEALRDCDAVRPPTRWYPKGIGAEQASAVATTRLAERELHRFYIRGLCCRALHQGVESLEIYRARPADPGRAPANAMIGVRISVRSLLEDLRGTFDSWPPHGLPQCRDAGLSVRLPDEHRLCDDHTDLVTRSATR
jgi:hypothetical protein